MSMDRIRQDLGITRTTLSTHVVDAALGRPAAGLHLAVTGPDGEARRGRTDAEGRARIAGDVEPGEHTLVFETGPWYAAQGRETCYPSIEIRLTVTAGEQHQVALLLSPFSYTTHKSSGEAS